VPFFFLIKRTGRQTDLALGVRWGYKERMQDGEYGKNIM
jgi:hypothetical protein